MDKFWILPIVAFVTVIIMTSVGYVVRADLPERYIEPILPVKKVHSGLSPYVEFCDPDTEFYPIKLIDNSTHIFNHEFCVWDLK